MVNRVVSVEFTEKGASRITGALKDIDKAATHTAASATTSGNRIGTAFQKAQSGGVKGLADGFSALAPQAFVATAALTGVAASVTSLINAGREQEKATRLTEAVLRSTGGAAGVTAQQVEGLASSLSRVSGVQDEVIQHGENVLLTFRSVRNEAGKGNDIFTQGTKAAVDLSAALGQDLQSSVIQIGKALNDPIAGMTALRRVGVSFTESQKEQIKTLTESGHLLEAQKVILGELKAEFGGAAAAAADPFSKLDASVKELKESIGAGLIPVVTRYVNEATGAVGVTDRLVASLNARFGGGGGAGGAGTPGKGLFAVLTAGLGPAGSVLNTAANLTGVFDDKKPDAVAKAVDRLNTAQKQLIKDSAAAGTSQKKLAADANEVRAAQTAVTAITNRANAALGGNAKQADQAKFAYLGLGIAVKTVADAFSAVSSRAFNKFDLSVTADKSTSSFYDSVAALHQVDTANAASTASTQTAASAAVDRASKEGSLRDAQQGVVDADKAAKDAQTALTTARKNYEDVMHGVAANTLAAKDAEEDYTQAQDNAKSSVLDLRDAHRQLADAIEAQRIAGREANEALGSANRSRAGARLDVQDAKVNLADAREGGDPEEIARAQLALGDAEQRLRDATEAVTQARKDKTDASKKNSKADDDVRRAQIGVTEASINNTQATRDQNEAQRVLNGTLHGFPPSSKEAQDALHNLQDATHTAREATDGLTDAQRELFRATADMNGALTSLASGGIKKASTGLSGLVSKFLDVKSNAKSMAEDVGANIAAATGSVSRGILAEIHALQGAVAAEPLLANAFGQVFKNLERDYIAAVSAEAFKSGKSIVPGGAGHKILAGSFDKGGVVPGSVGSPQLILAHGGETVVPPLSMRNSRPMGGAGGPVTVNINVQSLDPKTAQRLVVEALQRETATNGFVARVRTG